MTAAANDAPPPLRAALVTNIPAPYRVPVLARLAAMPGIDLRVFFCSGREPDRQWNFPEFDFPHVFLRERFITWRGRFIHFNPDLWSQLTCFAPRVVITTGFNPTHLLGWWWARRNGSGHVAMTDGTLASESALLGRAHQAVRRRVYGRTQAFVGASEGSFNLYRSYGVDEAAMFKSHLCADNVAFAAAEARERSFDFIFCGRFVAGKLPLFAIDVAASAGRLLGRRTRLLLVGAGPLDVDARRRAGEAAGEVECIFAGFATQQELPHHYERARLMLFPTAGDTWGVVANEACAAGLPVVTSPQAGAAGELVRDGVNGRVLPLDAQTWAAAAAAILGDDSTWRWMSARSRELVAPYTYDNAAAGLAAAIAHAAQP